LRVVHFHNVNFIWALYKCSIEIERMNADIHKLKGMSNSYIN
jgi:hypothetical protein